MRTIYIVMRDFADQTAPYKDDWNCQFRTFIRAFTNREDATRFIIETTREENVQRRLYDDDFYREMIFREEWRFIRKVHNWPEYPGKNLMVDLWYGEKLHVHEKYYIMATALSEE